MNRTDVLHKLSQLKPQLRAQFGVRELELFGSAARDELRSDSDVDVLVEFDVPATSSRYFGVQFAIEDALAMPVDLVTVKVSRAELRTCVERDRIRV
jgi:predicted nucleotidyltransferase